MANVEKGLEEVLLEIGNRLLTPASAVDELLPLLDRAETLLFRVEQSPSQSMTAALPPAMKGLTSKELLGHSDVDVKVAVASCLSEITRITAPEALYDDDLMKEIFQVIVESFEKLDDMQNRSYAKRVSILEIVAKVRSCVVMLDLECDTLILEMFHHFLKTIRDSHPEDVFSSMEMIMTVILEESKDISPSLLSCLLTSVKKDNKDTLQIARRLADKVIGNCALKLKPCLMEAVQSLGSSLEDFSEIVALVCQEDSDQLEHSGLNISGECLADGSKLSVRIVSDEPPKGSGKLESEVACVDKVGNAAGNPPNSVMGNGTVQTATSGLPLTVMEADISYRQSIPDLVWCVFIDHTAPCDTYFLAMASLLAVFSPFVAAFFILQHFKTRGRVFSNRGRIGGDTRPRASIQGLPIKQQPENLIGPFGSFILALF